jgi:hypothetical protein
MNKYEVEELTPGDLAQWNALVDDSVHGTIFHKTGWLDACARALGMKVKIFGCFQNGKLVGGCSLFLKQKWGLVTSANSSCITTPFGGFILSSLPSTSVHKQETFSRGIIESLLRTIEKEHFINVSITNSPEFLDIRPFTWNGWRSSVSYAYYINLNNYLEANLDSSAKRHIRKAEKNRIFIEPYSEISRYYALYCDTYTRKNLEPPAPKNLFSELYSFIKDNNCGEMIAAKTSENEIAVAEIIVWDKRQAFSWTTVSDSKFLNSGASTLIMNDNMKRLKDRGIPKINIMRANIPQLSSFATSFNPILVPYYQIRRLMFDNILALKNFSLLKSISLLALGFWLNLTEVVYCSDETCLILLLSSGFPG